MSAFTAGQQHHLLAKVEVVTQIDWWEEDDRLLVMNHYNIRRSNTTNNGNLRWQNSNPSQLGPDIKTSWMCPHKHPRRWLERFFRELAGIFQNLPSGLPCLILVGTLLILNNDGI
jgi:hypothetical protein